MPKKLSQLCNILPKANYHHKESVESVDDSEVPSLLNNLHNHSNNSGLDRYAHPGQPSRKRGPMSTKQQEEREQRNSDKFGGDRGGGERAETSGERTNIIEMA